MSGTPGILGVHIFIESPEDAIIKFEVMMVLCNGIELGAFNHAQKPNRVVVRAFP